MRRVLLSCSGRLAFLSLGPLGMAITASLILVGFGGWQAYNSREVALADARLDVANLSHSLAQQAQGSINAVDLVLHGFVERLEHNGLAERASFEQVMHRFVGRLAQVRDLAVLDSEGRWLLSSHGSEQPLSSADRAYFEWHRTHPGKALHVGDLIESRVDGRRIITLSVRYDHPDGSFGGVMRAALDPEYFQRVYQGMSVGEHGVVALDSTAGRILARVPVDPALIGRDVSGQPYFRDGRLTASQGVLWKHELKDQSWLIAGFEVVEGYPLFVFVAKNAGEALAPWLRQATVEGAILLMAIVILIGTGDRLRRQHERLRLAEAKADRARELAEQADRAKSEFLATMSHEVRTPLNGVLGFANLLLARTDLSDEARRQIGFIASSGSVLLTVVNDVLTYASAEAGHLQLDMQPFSPAAVADEVVAITQHAAEAKGIALRCGADSSQSVLYGDAARLRQVLHNLVSNAIKFTSDGVIAVDVRSRPTSSDAVDLLVSVADTGIGIAPDKLGRLFKRFSQVDASVNRKFGGAGLGLAISKRLVEAMGGEIGVRSVPGEGSTFWFSLPLRAAASQASPAAFLQRGIHRRGRALCILLAEDHEVNREIAHAILTGAGHAVDTVADGVAAVQAASAVRYDLILMDVQMPVMDGMEATRLIRAGNGASRTAPIVALTANVLPDQIAAFRAACMGAHIGKPFDPDELLATVERCAVGGVAVAA